MEYFNGMNFLRWAANPACTAWVDKSFDGYYTIQFNAAGPLHWRVADAPDRVYHGPCVWITFPGVRFRYGSRGGAGWSHRYVAFNGPRVKKYIADGLLPVDWRPPIRAVGDPEHFQREFDELLDRLNASPLDTAAATHLLEGLLLRLHAPRAHPGGADVSHARDYARRLAESIAHQPARAWDFAAASRQGNISYHHLRRVFQQQTGLAPQQFLIQRRLMHAAGLLCRTTLPLKAVAEQSGVPDVYHFSKLFRARHKLPPGRYRKEFSPN